MKNKMPSNNIVAEEVFKTLVPRVDEELTIKEVTIKDIKEIIKKSKPSKSRGNDELNMLIIKLIPDFLAICIAHLVNCIIRMGIFLQTLKTSHIIPIHKNKKDKKQLSSFCPINNWNVVEKIVETVLKKQVTDFINKNDIVNNNMHSSHLKHGVIMAKIDIDEKISQHKDDVNQVSILSTDLSTAYDTVDHCLLLSKLEHLGYQNKTYRLFESYLQN